MSQIADIESRGAATVYRFTESSIRRGLDHGKSSSRVIDSSNDISASRTCNSKALSESITLEMLGPLFALTASAA